jgi:hypothetical protein
MAAESMSLRDMLFWFFLTLFGTGTYVIYRSQGEGGEILGIALIIVGFIGMIGCAWPLLKDPLTGKVRVTWSLIQRVIHNPLYVKARNRLILAYAVLFAVTYVHTLRSDLDTFIMPRTVTTEQAEKLRDYLSKREPFAVVLDVVPNDQEAAEYAAELFNALSKTNWDVNPPDHSGPSSISIPFVPRPKLNDVGSNGKPVYRNIGEYEEAHDKWLESEIDRSVPDRMYPNAGLFIEVELPGQPTNPDPKHPRPDTVLQDALLYAGIPLDGGSGSSADKGKYSILLRISHRRRQLPTNFRQSMLFRLGRWIMGLSRR